MKSFRLNVLTGAIFALALFFGARASSNEAPTKTASAGVYTTEEAERGAAVYSSHCAVCHREDMGGKDPAPELAGETFMSKWQGKSAGDLFTRTRTTMPFGKPDSLTQREYLDLLALMLEANEFEPGTDGLPQDAEALNAIKIE
jgi:S-disulfanyl-L-cysteine oxidoreductase SoxD